MYIYKMLEYYENENKINLKKKPKRKTEKSSSQI